MLWPLHKPELLFEYNLSMQVQTILEIDAFTDPADDVHESHVGGFCVPKCPDVEGSQQQRV